MPFLRNSEKFICLYLKGLSNIDIAWFSRARKPNNFWFPWLTKNHTISWNGTFENFSPVSRTVDNNPTTVQKLIYKWDLKQHLFSNWVWVRTWPAQSFLAPNGHIMIERHPWPGVYKVRGYASKPAHPVFVRSLRTFMLFNDWLIDAWTLLVVFLRCFSKTILDSVFPYVFYEGWLLWTKIGRNWPSLVGLFLGSIDF